MSPLPAPIHTLCFLLVALSACGSESKPELWGGSDKADELGMTAEPKGRLSFGGEVFGDFTEEDQEDAYFFSADAGTVITLDNSNLGTAAHLDSTLFLYGPKDDFGVYPKPAIGLDDDGGWKYHAKIKSLRIPSRGDYLVVISTYAGADRGRYRLELECEGDRCIIPCDETCGHKDPCGSQTCDEVDGCIAQELVAQCSDINITAPPLVTSASGGTDRFIVNLLAMPTENVIIHLSSSDPDQAVVYPQKINFCKQGDTEQSNGCKKAEIGSDSTAGRWDREVVVTVTGVRSLNPDGDVPFTISMSVETEDSHYAGTAISPVLGRNLGDSPAPSLEEFAALRDAELLAALYTQTNDHRAYGYRGQNNARDLMFATVDVHGGQVESLYKGYTIARPLHAIAAFESGFNAEHTWPQAQFDEVEPTRSDLHHIFPADIDANRIRSSYDFGITSPNSTRSRLGSRYQGSGTVYQVRPSRRGDVARAHFYLVARYQNDTTLGLDFDDDRSRSNGSIKNSEEAVLRAWHAEDPVDDLERIRNNRVEGFQGNRNPFIDRPTLVDQIADF